MALKVSLILFINVGFAILSITLAATMTQEQRDNWASDLFNKTEDDCGEKISDENLELLEDDLEADNEEIRTYEACVFESIGYIKDGKFMEEKMLDDVPKYVNDDDDTKDQAKTIVNICKKEAEDNSDNVVDLIGKFINCVIDRSKSDL